MEGLIFGIIFYGNAVPSSPQIRESEFRNQGNFYLWNARPWVLESGIQLKESGIPSTIGNQNPSCNLHDHYAHAVIDTQASKPMARSDLLQESCVRRQIQRYGCQTPHIRTVCFVPRGGVLPYSMTSFYYPCLSMLIHAYMAFSPPAQIPLFAPPPPCSLPAPQKILHCFQFLLGRL